MFLQLKNLIKGNGLRSIEVNERTVLYHEIHADIGENLPLIIGLHGYGSHERQMETLVPLDISQPHIYVAPRAFETVYTGGYSWHPIEFVDGQIRAETKALQLSLKRVAHFIHEVAKEYRADFNRIYVVGYSMGGGMSMMLSLLHPGIASAFVVIAGRYQDNILDQIAPQSYLRDKPVFIGRGTLDNFISEDDMQNAVEFMTAQGMEITYRQYRIPHVVGTQEREDVSTWLNAQM